MMLLGTHSDPTPRIRCFQQPSHPQFRFEWHPTKKHAQTNRPGVVYVIRVGTMPEHAEPFAWEIENEGAAFNAVLIWLRGYKHRELETDFKHPEERLERSRYVGIG